MKSPIATLFALLLPLAACAPAAKPPVTHEKAATPPTTETRPVTDHYHGVEVTDAYRWLEKWDDPPVQAWSEAQNQFARGYLSDLPSSKAIHARVSEVLNTPTSRWWGLQRRGANLFALSWQPPKQQPYLVVMPKPTDVSKVRTLVDPNELEKDGSLSIDWFQASPDGKTVAVSMSRSGTEAGDVHFYDVASGKEVHESIAHVNGGTAAGSLAWSADGKGVFYTRYPRAGERPEKDLDFYVQVYFHPLGGDVAKDRYELGKDFPRVAEIGLELDPSSGRILATVQNGDGGEFAHYVRGRKGTWRQFSKFGDRTIQATFGPHNDLLILSRANAPKGKILRVGLKKLDVSKATVVVPEGKDSIVDSFLSAPSILLLKNRLFVLYQLGGPSEIRAFDLHGKKAAAPEQLPVATAGGMCPSGDKLLFSNGSFTTPSAWFEFDPHSAKTTRTALATKAILPIDDARVSRSFATSKDGTKVPVNLILPAKAEGAIPMVVTGYGGYGISLSPYYRPDIALLLDQGVGVAIANLRGGGEYGETWHSEGNLTHKQNVFDDFAAVLDHVVEQGLTSPDRIVIMGGSNGGLLMGATLTQHPDKMKAVVSFVGIYDMLRVELSPNGAFNITEFGTVKNKEQFEALYAYSPYHHVQKGTHYPPVLFLTGANDPRVDPMQSRKMTAQLQAAGDSLVLLRTSGGGHGGSKSHDERIEEASDVLAFILAQLGVPFSS